MTPRGLPRNWWWVAAMCAASAARAGVWTADPVLGLAAEYSSNPALLYVDHDAETHGAVLLDAPTTYHADDLSLSLQPSFRLSDSKGYSSLASDYAHLTATAELDADLDTWVFTGQVARDSSLYYNFEVNGASGVRRDTSLGDLNWQRQLTERLKFALDLDTSRVVYGQSGILDTLTDYRYSYAMPSLSWALDERSTLSLSGDVGLYDSSTGATKSVNSYLEAGFARQLGRMWSLTVKGGYSRESDKVDEYFGPFLLGQFTSTSNGTVFSASLARQSERLNVTASASRSLVPSGFAFLSLQQSYLLGFTYAWTERWNLNGHVQRLTAQEPQTEGPTIEQSYWSAGLAAVWLWTEKWTVTISATRVNVTYSPVADASASGAGLQLSRRFGTIKW